MCRDAARRIAASAAVAGLLVLAGCGRKKEEAPPPPPPKAASGLHRGVLAFASRGALWVLAKGGAPEQVNAGPVWFPALSGDCKYVAYWVDQGEAMALDVMNLEDGARTVTRIGSWRTLGPLGRNLNLRNAPFWLPGTTSLLFADGRQIWQVDADGGNLQTVYEHPDGGCYAVTASPKADRYAFIGANEKEQNLWVYSTKTKKADALTDYTLRTGAAGGPAWSPVEDRIVFVLYKAEEANLYAIPAEGGTALAITHEGRTNAPWWDPTGAKLAVSSGTQNSQFWQVALVNPHDGKFLEGGALTSAPAGAYAPTIAGEW